MGQDPLVTVILVLYKKFDNVFRAIDSVLNQTYSKIELIVTDDGSPNFPKDDIFNYICFNKKKNIVNVQILDNKVNVGTVKHANNAFSKAKGKLIKGLAGDDVLYDEFVIEKIVKRFLEKPFNLLSTSSISYNMDGSFYRFYPHIETGKIINSSLRDAKKQYIALTRWQYHDLASGSTMVFNLDFFKEIGGFDESYRLWEDGPFMYAVTKAGYYIDTAFDIVSIKYSQGGMSAGGNPILENDVARLIKLTLETDGSDCGMLQRRYLEYFYKKNICKTHIQRIKIYLIYLDIFVLNKIYRYGEKRRARKDLDYFNNNFNVF